MAQTFSGAVTFGNANQYSFDYEIVCDTPPTSATLIVTYTTPLPPGLVPQLHLGGGVFVAMSGSGPFTYNFTGLVNCNFSFSFWMAFAGGGLYQSPEPLTPNNTPLPIHLLSFDVVPYNSNSADLTWTSSTEINSDRYEIERSIDGIHWDFVDKVSAAGNSVSSIHYNYLDADLPVELSTLFYYRLKMIDLDGTFEYSDIKTVNFDAFLDDIISIYPNPTQDELIIDLTKIETVSGNIDLGIYSVAGKTMLYKQLNNDAVEVLNVFDLPSASYQIVLFRDGRRIHQRSLLKLD